MSSTWKACEIASPIRRIWIIKFNVLSSAVDAYDAFGAYDEQPNAVVDGEQFEEAGLPIWCNIDYLLPLDVTNFCDSPDCSH